MRRQDCPSSPGLPILPEIFLEHHKDSIFPIGSSTVSETYLPLVLTWPLQALSGLISLHSHNDFYYNGVTVSNCWLSSNLPLSLSHSSVFSMHSSETSGAN
jgi:hypothetical protein